MKILINQVNELNHRMDELLDLKNTNQYKIREAEEFIEIIKNNNHNNYPNAQSDIRKLTDDIEYWKNEIEYGEERLTIFEEGVIRIYIRTMKENKTPVSMETIQSIKNDYMVRSNLLCSLLDKYVDVNII